MVIAWRPESMPMTKAWLMPQTASGCDSAAADQGVSDKPYVSSPTGNAAATVLPVGASGHVHSGL